MLHHVLYGDKKIIKGMAVTAMAIGLNCMTPQVVYTDVPACSNIIIQENSGNNITNCTIIMVGGNMHSNIDLTVLSRINDIAALEENWNENGAPSFGSYIIDEMKKIASVLPVQPEVFPTANGSIQFEYEKDDESYLEFELFPDKSLKIFTMDSLGECETKQFNEVNLDKIVEAVNVFYA